MKLQHLIIIFIAIIMPISMVMASYIQNQIDVISLQTSYTSNLNTATYDAMKAFQINTVNNKYSSISDSKIRDIEASISTFYNSLGTAMSTYIASQEELKLFVPAILFNLYDGYYIYSSYNNTYEPNEVVQGTDIKVNIRDGVTNYQDALKPYIYYSCKYKLGAKTIVVNFTLDNAITVYGDVGDGKGYQTRSGYLINPDYVQNINMGAKTLTYNGLQIGPETLTEHLLTIEKDASGTEYEQEGDYQYIVYNNKKVYLDTHAPNASKPFFWYDNNKKTYLESETANVQAYINANGVGFKSISAFEYYYEAKQFSEWVNAYLKDIKAQHVYKASGELVGSEDEAAEYLRINTEGKSIFKTDSLNDPMLSTSVFNNHRMAIIRKSIETNLGAAIANFNSLSGGGFEFTMPVINEEDWYKVTNNVSIISFMQGLPIGQKYYNNYTALTNTKNEEVINSQSVYVVARDSSGNLEYHQPGCSKLLNSVADGTASIEGTYTALSFMRQTVKLSEVANRYFYPQGRTGKTTTGCYNCIVDSSSDFSVDGIVSGTIIPFSASQVVPRDITAVRRSYLTGLARERYDLYKSNF